MLNLPVYAMFYKGGYLSRPRWASFDRRGKLVLDVFKILDQDAISRKTPEEIHGILVDKLCYNEYEWQRQNQIPFKGKNLAEHIQRLLYVCPDCQGVNSFKSRGDGFGCSQCGAESRVNVYGEIEGAKFTDTVSWNKWQRTQLPRVVEQGFKFTSPGFRLEKTNLETGFQEKLVVDMRFTPSSVIIVGNGQEEELAIDSLSGLSITFMDCLDFFVGKTKYRFMFDPRKHMSIRLFNDLISTIKGEIV